MNFKTCPRKLINNGNELYPQYWSEFHAYCTFRGMSINPLGTPKGDPRYFYFAIGDFSHYHISLGVFLRGDSAMSANLNLNKGFEEAQRLFSQLKSNSEHFQSDFENELLFLDDLPRIFIIGLEKEADISDPNDWLHQFDWLCSNLEKMHEVFFPVLKGNQGYEETVWKAYSRLYREYKGWWCEECELLLYDDKHLLHTHHRRGRAFNEHEYLKALCIGCHAEQPGYGHETLKETEEYEYFMERYGKRWKRRRQNRRKY